MDSDLSDLLRMVHGLYGEISHEMWKFRKLTNPQANILIQYGISLRTKFCTLSEAHRELDEKLQEVVQHEFGVIFDESMLPFKKVQRNGAADLDGIQSQRNEKRISSSNDTNEQSTNDVCENGEHVDEQQQSLLSNVDSTKVVCVTPVPSDTSEENVADAIPTEILLLDNNDIASSSPNACKMNDAPNDYKSMHAQHLLIGSIGQLEGNSHSSSTDSQMTDAKNSLELEHAVTSIGEIQSEVTVETTAVPEGANVINIAQMNKRPKRNIKMRPQVEALLKRRRSHDLRTFSFFDEVKIKSKPQTLAAADIRKEMAVKKRHSGIRKSICYKKQENVEYAIPTEILSLDNNDIASSSSNACKMNDAQNDYKSVYVRHLLNGSIDQLEGNSHSSSADPHMASAQNLLELDHTVTSIGDIQSEVTAETTAVPEGANVINIAQMNTRSKINNKMRPEVESLLKRRRSCDMRVFSSFDEVKIEPKPQTLAAADIRKEMAEKKRHSGIRKTICYTKPPIRMDKDIVKRNIAMSKNTRKEMFPTDELYGSLCILCNKEKNVSLASHYARDHPESEVLISRPSPKMAQKIRAEKTTDFQSENGKLTGICVFCEETKTLKKNSWAQHLLTHTGEKTFVCTACDTKFKHLSEHSSMCTKTPSNIYLANSARDVIGFMCNDCNYTQFNRNSIVKHMKNEHSYIDPEGKCHYLRFTLVPELSKNRSRAAQ